MVRNFFPNLLSKENTSFLTSLIGIISANYGFLLGFVIVILWQTFNSAKLFTSLEAYNFRLMWHDCAVLKSISHEVRDLIGQYVTTIIHEEWPLMKVGLESSKISQIIDNFFKVLQSYVPQNEVEKNFYKEIVTQLNAVVQNRAQRLEYTQSILSGPLRFIIIVGALLLVFLLSLLENKGRRLHLFATIMVSSVIAFNVGLALTMDYPFSGDISISSKPFTQGVLSQYVSLNISKKALIANFCIGEVTLTV